MGDPNGGIRRVDALSAVAGGTVYVNPQIILINVDLDFFRFRHNRHGHAEV